MQLTQQQLRYWEYCYCDEILAAISKDRLLFMFDFADVQDILDKHYPKGHNVWYFNGWRDRAIAEQHFEVVTVNPVFVRNHFKEVLTNE